MANPKGGRPRGLPVKAEVLEKENKAVKLRVSGYTWNDIAKELGYADPSGAKLAFDRANRRIVQEDIDTIRKLETERLDALQNAHWQPALTGDVQAANLVLKVMERRSKLLGLDQPVRIQAEVITYDATDIRAELARIVANANPVATDSGPTLSLGEPESPTEPTTT